MSLISAVQGRYSDEMLSQSYRFDKDPENDKQLSKKSKRIANQRAKRITFRKNEIFFMGRKSVMINLRDITREASF